MARVTGNELVSMVARSAVAHRARGIAVFRACALDLSEYLPQTIIATDANPNGMALRKPVCMSDIPNDFTICGCHSDMWPTFLAIDLSDCSRASSHSRASGASHLASTGLFGSAK